MPLPVSQIIASIGLAILAAIALIWIAIGVIAAIVNAVIYFLNKDKDKDKDKKKRLFKWLKVCLKGVVFLAVVFVLWILLSVVRNLGFFGWQSGIIVD